MLETLSALHFQDLTWALKMLIIIFSALILSYTSERTLSFFEKKLSHNKTVWDDLTLRSAKKPMQVLIWVLGMAWATKVTGYHISVDLRDFVILLKDLGIIFCIAWFAWKIVAEYENHLTNQSRDNAVEVTTIAAVTKLLKISLFITATLMSLQSFGVSITGVVAFGGIGGVAIGFAARDLLANFFGAMMIFFDRPFLVGDHIRSPDRQIEGIVQYVSWRLTHIKTPDTRTLYIPNSLFSTIIIENLSRITNRRINETVALRYDDIDKAEKIIIEIKTMLINHKEIQQSQNILVSLSKLEKYALELTVEAFSITTNLQKYNALKQEILLNISAIIIRNNAEIALPTSVVSIYK